MDVFYFPFTYMPEKSIAAVKSFFKKPIFLQTDEMFLPDAMKASVAHGDVVMNVPVPGQGKKLVEMLSVFKDWGRSLDGKNRKYFKVQQKNIPFFSDLSVSKIKADLSNGIPSTREMIEPEEKPLTPQEILDQARLFLQLAQDLDVESEEVENGLRKYMEMENVLFDEIKGGVQEDDLSLSGMSDRSNPNGSRQDNLEARLGAWSVLFQYVENGNGVFVTDSEAVLGYLEEKEGIEAICRFGPVPTDMADGSALQNAVEAFLLQLSKGKVDTTGVDQIVLPDFQGAVTISVLEIYVVQGVSPRDFFSGMTPKNDVYGKGNRDSDISKMNTVLCLVRQNP